MEIIRPTWELVADGQNFPEGPAWNGRDTLYFSNCDGGTVMKVIHGRAGVEVFASAGEAPPTIGRTNGMVFGADNCLYACDFGHTPGIVRLHPDGSSEYLVTEFEGQPFVKPNDLAFDPDGMLYFTDSWKYEEDFPEGALYRLNIMTRAIERLDSFLSFPNGLAFSADMASLFMAESLKKRVLRYPVLNEGTLGIPDVFCEMPGGDPDGMNLDVEGNLYVAHFCGGAILVYSPDGELIRKIETPGSCPSNIDFAGDDLRTIYLTEDETHAVYKTTWDVPGLPLFWRS